MAAPEAPAQCTFAAESLAANVFKMADTNANGTLSKKELAASFCKLLGPSYASLMKQFASFDADGDGALTQAEFVALYAKMIESPGIAEALQAPTLVAAPEAPPPPAE